MVTYFSEKPSPFELRSENIEFEMSVSTNDFLTSNKAMEWLGVFICTTILHGVLAISNIYRVTIEILTDIKQKCELKQKLEMVSSVFFLCIHNNATSSLSDFAFLP